MSTLGETPIYAIRFTFKDWLGNLVSDYYERNGVMWTTDVREEALERADELEQHHHLDYEVVELTEVKK